MKKRLARWAIDVWYNDSLLGLLLLPFGMIFSGLVRFRQFLYRQGLLKSQTVAVPVIVVGNISVGGTGKTPLIIWMAQLLKNSGYRPGIISRGYGGEPTAMPQWVDKTSDPRVVGDEALLIAKNTECPMAVSPSRLSAANLLLSRSDCNVILSDDGLQHYALNRTVEIAVIDGERRFGNTFCLPAGPLREPIQRLQSVDFVVVNGGIAQAHEFSMGLVGDMLVNILTGEQKPLQAFVKGQCHALAGIGNPDRFFKLLASAGLMCKTHSFPDHYLFQPRDIEFGDDKPVLMTEKDAVKCAAFASKQHWYLPVQACPEPGFAEKLLTTLREKS